MIYFAVGLGWVMGLSMGVILYRFFNEEILVDIFKDRYEAEREENNYLHSLIQFMETTSGQVFDTWEGRIIDLPEGQ